MLSKMGPQMQVSARQVYISKQGLCIHVAYACVREGFLRSSKEGHSNIFRTAVIGDGVLQGFLTNKTMGRIHTHLHSIPPPFTAFTVHAAGHATAFGKLQAAAVQPVLWELQELPVEAEAYMRCLGAGRLLQAGPEAAEGPGLMPNLPPVGTPERAACMKAGQTCNALGYCLGGPMYCTGGPAGDGHGGDGSTQGACAYDLR